MLNSAWNTSSKWRNNSKSEEVLRRNSFSKESFLHFIPVCQLLREDLGESSLFFLQPFALVWLLLTVDFSFCLCYFLFSSLLWQSTNTKWNGRTQHDMQTRWTIFRGGPMQMRPFDKYRISKFFVQKRKILQSNCFEEKIYWETPIFWKKVSLQQNIKI